MIRASHADYDQAAAADRYLYRESGRLTAGATAFHQLDPSQAAMRMEEYHGAARAEAERVSLRTEVFSGLVEYLFADGPAPAEVRARMEGLFDSFHPDLASRIHGAHTWCDPEEVGRVLGKHRKKLAAVQVSATSRGSLHAWNRELEQEFDFDFVKTTIVLMVELLASEGHTWRHLVAVAYCLAKAFRAYLIAGMSLDDIARLSGDGGGRATPCDRAKRVVNRLIEASGAKGCHVHYNKSPEAIAKYQEAQMGNTNRKAKSQKLRKTLSQREAMKKKTNKKTDPRKK
ncbi:MAG: hypothetical protein V4819_19310 [Verrucomicrobiota bacterium]